MDAQQRGGSSIEARWFDDLKKGEAILAKSGKEIRKNTDAQLENIKPGLAVMAALRIVWHETRCVTRPWAVICRGNGEDVATLHWTPRLQEFMVVIDEQRLSAQEWQQIGEMLTEANAHHAPGSSNDE